MSAIDDDIVYVEQPQDRECRVPFSLFENKFDNGVNPDTFLPEPYLGLNGIIDWQDVVDLLTRFSKKEYAEKSHAPLFCPTRFTYSRSEQNATQAALVVIDVDDDDVPAGERMSFDQANDWFTRAGTEAILYTSASNRDGARFRIVIPLADLLTPLQQKRCVAAICDTLRRGWRPDRTKMNCYSMFYVPGLYKGADNRFVHLKGIVFPATSWCPDVYAEPEPEPIARPDTLSRDANWSFEYVAEQTDKYLSTGHDRHNAIFGLMCSAAMSARNRGYDLSAGELAEWAESIQALNHGRSPRNRRSLQRAAADALDFASSHLGDPINDRSQENDNGWEYPRHPDDTLSWWERDMMVGAPEQEGADRHHLRDDAAAGLWPSADEDRNTKPPAWLIEGMIPEDSNVIIYGPSGWLKSFLANEIMYAITTGLPALGRPMVGERAPVFFFSGEGYNAARTKRRAAWEIAHGFEPFTVPDVWFTKGVPAINERARVAAWIEAAKARLNGRRAGAFVIDTLALALGGEDEDKAHVATKYQRMIGLIRDEIGADVSITIGHTGKDRSRGIRGSSAYQGNYDVLLEIRNHHFDERSRQHTIEIFVHKMKDDDANCSIYARSRLVTTMHGDSLVLDPIDEEEAREIFGQGGTSSNGDDRATMSGLSGAEIERAIRELKPTGGMVASGDLCAKLAEQTGGKKETIERHLQRHRAPGQKFNRFWLPTSKMYAIPGEHMEGCRDSLTDMLAQLSDIDALRHPCGGLADTDASL